MLLSVVAHALLLSIPLDGDLFGLPGLRFPWEERRLTPTELRIVLAPVPVPVPVPVSVPVSAPSAAPAIDTPATPPDRAATPAAAVMPAPVSGPRPFARASTAAAPEPATVLPAPTEIARDEPSPQPDDAAARIIALENEQREKTVREERLRHEVARQAAAEADTARMEQARQAQLAAAEQQRQADVRRDAQRQEQADLAAQEQAARDALARADARREAERVAAAQREAARIDADRQEQSRLAQLEAARQDALKAEAGRQAQLQQAQARPAQTAQEAQREERLRAIGRQLAQEAAQPTVSGQRRGWLMGRADPNTELVTYAQAMGRKIELNMTFDTVRDAIKQPYRQPVVTVAVRSDGSVERVTFVTSSGVPAIDNAIRQIVASQAPYGPFPPNLARQYDVVEIRRTWIFDIAVRLE